MKPGILTLLFLFLLGPLVAQVTINNSILPAAGDTILVSTDNLPTGISLTAAGPDQTWDFTTLQAPFSTSIAYQDASAGSVSIPGASLVAELAPNVETYFQITDNDLSVAGVFGQIPIAADLMLTTNFDPPMVEVSTPMNFLDLDQGSSDVLIPVPVDELPGEIFDQLPITPDSIRIKLVLDRTDLVDAWGTVMIPGGIYDVLRRRRFQTREARIEARVSILPWADVTDLLVMALPPLEEFFGLDTTITYDFYANDYQQPVVSLNVGEDDQTINSVNFRTSDIVNNIQDINAIKPGVYVFPNPAVANVKFEFNNLPSGNYQLTIYNIIGREVWSKNYNLNGDFIEQVNLGFLRRGTYLYSLQDEYGKTIMTRRLVIVSP